MDRFAALRALLMCNAQNHSWDCSCGFGGDTGGGGGGWRGRVTPIINFEPISRGWARDRCGTVQSYVNPNAHCPVCGAKVYFYRSPYDGRVFFDQLGWPWPKHWCTDNGREPRRAARDVTSIGTRIEPAWRDGGWQPLLSAKRYSNKGQPLVTGDMGGAFSEFCLPKSVLVDKDSPIFVRHVERKPFLFEATFLWSDHLKTHERKVFTFDPRIAPVGEDTIFKAAAGDVAANCVLGQFILWDLGDPQSARPYLEAAGQGGSVEALIELAVMLFFRKEPDTSSQDAA